MCKGHHLRSIIGCHLDCRDTHTQFESQRWIIKKPFFSFVSKTCRCPTILAPNTLKLLVLELPLSHLMGLFCWTNNSWLPIFFITISVETKLGVLLNKTTSTETLSLRLESLELQRTLLLLKQLLAQLFDHQLGQNSLQKYFLLLGAQNFSQLCPNKKKLRTRCVLNSESTQLSLFGCGMAMGIIYHFSKLKAPDRCAQLLFVNVT